MHHCVTYGTGAGPVLGLALTVRQAGRRAPVSLNPEPLRPVFKKLTWTEESRLA
jgi:hypothetical protein